jgi:hypothetical protein
MATNQPESRQSETAVSLPAGASRTRLAILIAGALFVLVPSSEVVHASVRATLGVGGVQCC